MSKTETKNRRKKLEDVRAPINSAMRLLDIDDLMNFTRMSRTTIDRLAKAGDLPKPIFESGKGVQRLWTLGSIEQWIRRAQNEAEGLSA